MNLMDLFIKIGIDDQATSKIGKITDSVGKGLATAAAVGAAAVGAAATGIATLTKLSIDGYAEYEQLVGGVDTLFKSSSDKVMAYAENAYKTAGLSANEYMSTVTSFSASLLQSLGGDTEAAAEYANTAITDMSDNANKMGTSMEMIQNAYQGFAKQNFTMLDNLKLGYGGTKEEMERLLEDAEKLSGQKFDISSYADIVDAIHIVQTEMGITGTTAKEASETISGSLAAAKSAWQNLVTGVADDNANFDKLIENFVQSVGTVADNVIPRIGVALEGAGKLIEELVPVIIDKVPTIVQDTLPSLLESGMNMVSAIVEGITNNLPELITSGIDMLMTVAEGLIGAIPGLIEKLPEVITAIVVTLGENAPRIFQAGVDLITALVNGLIQSIPNLVKNIPQIVKAILTGLSAANKAVNDVGKNIVRGLWNGIKSMAGWITNKVKGFFNGIVNGAKNLLGIHSPSRVFAGIGENMALGVGAGWDNEFSRIKKDVESGLNFGTATFDFMPKMKSGYEAVKNVGRTISESAKEDITIVVQSVLDGRIIGETAYKYSQNKARAYGRA